MEPRARCRQDGPAATAREGTDIDNGIMKESKARSEQLGCVRAEGWHGTGVAEPCGTLGTLSGAGHTGRAFVLPELGSTSLLLHLSPSPSPPLS